MDRSIRHVATGLIIGLMVCGIALGFWALVVGDSLTNRQDNARRLEQSERGRGAILARSGQPLAQTVVRGDQPVREYPVPAAAHPVGFHHRRFGSSELEERYDDLLRGDRGDVLQRLRQRFLGAPTQGADLVTTLDVRVQQASAAALGQARGAIVAIDPRTGAILAMVSQPGFDPSTLAQRWDTLGTDPSAPLLNRAVQATYPPGSTFKVITAAAALERGIIDSEVDFRCTTAAQVDGLSADCRNHSHLAVVNFRQAFAWSCNRTFALTGLFLSLGGPLAPRLDDRAVAARAWADTDVRRAAEILTGQARAFGFERATAFDLPVAMSRMKGDGDWYPSLLAQTAFGQGELATSPLQMALVAAAVGNEGVVPVPYLADYARLPSGAERPLRPVIASALSPVQQRAMSPATAATLKRFMQDSAEYAYAQQAKIPGVTVAGKTGTAETGRGETPHAWFIGFAPVDRPAVAVAVIVEHGGAGSEVAAPIARRVMAAALGR